MRLVTSDMTRIFWLLAIPFLLSGCDQLKERAGFVDPARVEAEGKAIGGACRHAGRGLEDCYRLNRTASKAAVFAGWREMNEYMAKNNMAAMPPDLAAPQLAPPPTTPPASPPAAPAEATAATPAKAAK